jgi:hypothetical protein
MSKKEDSHTKGEQHRSEGKKYKEPNGVLDMLSSTRKSEDTKREENKSYKQGWDNAGKK